MAKQPEILKETAENPDANSTESIMQAVISDKFAGHGGTYLYDPATGTRTRVETEN